MMQRCINNATGLLNAPLPWGPLWLSEHCVCVCVSWPLRRERGKDIERDRDRESGAELQSAQVTLVASFSLSLFLCVSFFLSLYRLLCDPGQMNV